MKNLDRKSLEALVRKMVTEQLGEDAISLGNIQRDSSGVASIKLKAVTVDESNRMDTGKKDDLVYTKDLLTLEESPRLGCGLMEMKETTFDWTLKYDEIDYIIEGFLEIIIDGRKVCAEAGEVIFIPKNTRIQFSAPGHARFLYVTYPADWANQA
jgi:ethanolamine utilization protein EutQ